MKLSRRQRLAAIRARIAAVPHGKFEEMAPKLLRAVDGISSGDFQTIDNEIGNAARTNEYGGNGWALRTMRNTRYWADRMYASFDDHCDDGEAATAGRF